MMACLKFLINDNIVKGKNLTILDSKNNQYFLEDGIIDLNKDEFIGKDIEINFENSLFSGHGRSTIINPLTPTFLHFLMNFFSP